MGGYGRRKDWSITLPQKAKDSKNNTTYTCVLPANMVDDDTAIAFISMYQKVSVYVNDMLIYSRGNDRLHPKIAGAENGWNVVSLPANCGGDKLTIKLSDGYGYKYISQLSGVYISKESHIYIWLLLRNFPGLLLEGLMFIYAIILIGMTLVYSAIDNDNVRWKSIYLALLIATLAVWLHFGTVNIPLIFIDNYVAKIISYGSFMVFPLPFLRYYAYMYNDNKEKKSLLNIIFWIVVANIVISVFLVFSGVCTYMNLVPSAQILVLVSMAAILTTGIKKIIQKQTYIHIIDVAAVFMFMIINIFELSHFYNGSAGQIGILSRMGMVVYVSLLFAEILLSLRNMKKTYQITKDKLSETGTRLMASQIQPHFICNSLGAISYIVTQSPDEACDLIIDLSDYLRDNVKAFNSIDLIDVEEEIKHVKRYLKIEKARFEDRLNYVFDIQTTDFKIPALTIQPIVENAVKHGVCKKENGGTVVIKIYQTNSNFYIEVSDDGIGFDTKEFIKNNADNDSYGIKNVKYRLIQQLNARFQVESQPGNGTIVEIIIPKQVPGAKIEKNKRIEE